MRTPELHVAALALKYLLSELFGGDKRFNYELLVRRCMSASVHDRDEIAAVSDCLRLNRLPQECCACILKLRQQESAPRQESKPSIDADLLAEAYGWECILNPPIIVDYDTANYVKVIHKAASTGELTSQTIALAPRNLMGEYLAGWKYKLEFDDEMSNLVVSLTTTNLDPSYKTRHALLERMKISDRLAWLGARITEKLTRRKNDDITVTLEPPLPELDDVPKSSTPRYDDQKAIAANEAKQKIMNDLFISTLESDFNIPSPTKPSKSNQPLNKNTATTLLKNDFNAFRLDGTSYKGFRIFAVRLSVIETHLRHQSAKLVIRANTQDGLPTAVEYSLPENGLDSITLPSNTDRKYVLTHDKGDAITLKLFISTLRLAELTEKHGNAYAIFCAHTKPDELRYTSMQTGSMKLDVPWKRRVAKFINGLVIGTLKAENPSPTPARRFYNYKTILKVTIVDADREAQIPNVKLFQGQNLTLNMIMDSERGEPSESSSSNSFDGDDDISEDENS